MGSAHLQPAEAGTQAEFQLEKPGFVTIAIDDASGNRVRNLVGGKWFEAGKQSLHWDGLGDAGEPVPAGVYRWKGITHEGISTQFEAAFNSPGSPPWVTAQIPAQRNVRASGSGGWLSDHERPICAFSDGGHVYFGAEIAEAGHSIMELDLDGRKVWGTLWLGLSGANAIFRTNDILYVAGEKGWMKDSLAVHRLDATTHKVLPNPTGTAVPSTETAFIKVGSDQFSEIKGMVVTTRFLVLSLGDKGRLALFDTESGKYLRDIPLPDTGAIVKVDNDSVLAISGAKVVRVDLESGNTQTIIEGALEKPAGLAVSSKGNILVADAGEAAQVVKIFSPAGALVGTIGKPGGRKEGLFDPEAMSHPRALAVDARDRIWVGEYSYLPKRISVWTMDGKLERDWTGPSYYGGGGALDPENSSRAFYKGMEFSVAPWPEASRLRAILFRPEDHQDLPYPTIEESRTARALSDCDFYAKLPQAPVYQGKRLYLLNDEGYGTDAMLVGEVQGDHLIPRAVFGSLKTIYKAWKDRHPEFVATIASGVADGNGVFLWQDLNGDGKAEPAEVKVQADWKFGAMWGMRSWPTLNLYARTADGSQVVEIPPGPDGSKLSYNLDAAKLIPLPTEVVKRGLTALAPDTEGNILVNTGEGGNQGDPANMYYSISPGGRVNWTYPNPFPANWHNSPRPKPGNIQHTLNVEGVVPLGGDIGNIFQLNGNKGVRYLFTTDGLFLTQLYGDMRNAPTMSSCQEASRGLRMNNYSLADECFSGWFGKSPDGDVLQIAGKDSSNIMKVCGLETLHRLAGGELNLKNAAQAARSSEEVAPPPIAPPPIETIQLSGIPTGWEKIRKYQLMDDDRVVWIAMGYQSDALQLSVTVEKSPPFANSGDDPKTLFKTGSAVDLLISKAWDAEPGRTSPVPGDMRFIFSTWRGKPVAVRYRFVVPDTDEANKSKFASPTGVAVVDEVSVVKDIEVKIEDVPGGWKLSARIPWKSLGLDKPPKESLRGDIGLIVSDPEGTRAVARHYYFDRGGQVVSDLPSEVRVNPSKWGQILF